MKKSPAIQLLDLAWENTNGSTPHSWDRLNHSMSGALRHAIDYGFTFHEDDFEHIANNYRSGRWLGEHGVAGYYARCICGGDGKHRNDAGRTDHNISAIRSLEKYLGREPVRFDGYRLHDGAVIQFWFPEFREVSRETMLKSDLEDRKAVVSHLKKHKDRLGTKVKITSIDDRAGIWLTCEYKSWRGDWPEGGPTKRHKLTGQDFRDHETWFNAAWFPKTRKNAA